MRNSVFGCKQKLDKYPQIVYNCMDVRNCMEDCAISVTLKEIAEELNISVNAVSRALRNMADIGPETIKRVYEAAQRLGYRKNLAASCLKTAKSMMLGIIIPDVCNPVFSYMYTGIEKVCSKNGYTLMLSNIISERTRDR